jgi:hypothetical protein
MIVCSANKVLLSKYIAHRGYPNGLEVAIIYSLGCSLSCSLIPNKYSSSLRASSPCLEPEKELPCLGEAIPALIFAVNTGQISFVRPPARTSQGVGSRSIHLAMPGVDPDCLRLRHCLELRSIQWCPCVLPLPTADGRPLRRHASLQPRCARLQLAIAGGGRALRAPTPCGADHFFWTFSVGVAGSGSRF